MVVFWKKLGLFLGWGGIPPGEREPAVNEPVVAGISPSAYWALGFDTPLPGMRGRYAVPVGPGRTRVVPFGAITVSETFGLFDYLSQRCEQWPFGQDVESFGGYVALEGPGWDLTVLFHMPAPLVEYHAGRWSDGTRVTGQVAWPIVAQALVLAPDYDSVAGYLKLNPYRTTYVA